jgi:hypothetical protein
LDTQKKKKIMSFSTVTIQFLIDWIEQDFDTTKLKECAAQWTYIAHGCDWLMCALTPLYFIDIVIIPL